MSIWIDEVEITLGDSLRQKIDEGLRTSKFGVVILSPAFFGKRWTQWELDGLADREMSSGTKVILPIWHDVGHDDVAAHSPSLAGKDAARTSNGIEQIASEIAEVLKAPAGGSLDVDRVPRMPEEEAALLRTCPDGWEYLLFAAVLRREMDALEPKYRDHEIGYAAPAYGPVLEGVEAMNFLSDAFGHGQVVLANFNRVMDLSAQERAFGKPEESGDADRIVHLAKRVIDIYEDLLDWAARLRATAIDDRFQRALDLAGSFVNGPIRQFREFVDHTVVEIDRVPALLREETGDPITLTIVLELSIDEGVEKELASELKRLRRSF